jgi:hypothetical protein
LIQLHLALSDEQSCEGRLNQSLNDPVIWKRFQQLSKDTRIPASKLLDEAMEDLLKKYGK